ncbi:ATP-binding protein [Candidatus Dojkabacteria bacterium]|jgi:DNA topoisomerase-2|nr:ATP-binding protein [Candidatus Dojkabacteria bacterium]
MEENKLQQTIEEKFQVKTEIEHILDRSGMWIGSIYSEQLDYLLYQPSTNKIIPVKNTLYNAGLLKLIDEIISNSIDEYRRKDAMFKLNEIWIEANQDGTIIIRDNGGIPVVKHKGLGIILPEMIFGHLRTSSNYDDTQERDWIGTNGLGAKLTNIFSKEFSVETCDTKNKVKIEWFNNMKESNKDEKRFPLGFEVIPSNEHYTEIKFKIDLKRFEIEQLTLSTIRIIQKRCIDGAASNLGLKINFKSNIAEGKLDSTWQFESFDDYVKLHLSPEQSSQEILSFNSKQLTLRLLPSIGFNVGVVNGALCSEGTHITKVENQIIDKLLDICNELEMDLFTPKDISNRITLFVNTSIPNPTYDSQTKTKLTNKIDKYALSVSKEFLEQLKTSDILENLKDYYHIKYAAEKAKQTKKLNQAIKATKTRKLITCVSQKAEGTELWLFEGNSASNGFRKHSRKMNQAAYLLRGKIKNTFSLKREQILENIELREVLSILKILFDEPKQNLKNLAFEKVIIASDMDEDGHHICGLLIAFFGKHFVEIIKAGKLFRALSPIIIGQCPKKPKLYFYSDAEFKEFEKNNSIKGYDFIYTKGLGGLEDEDYKQMLRNQKLLQFTIEDLYDIESINIWFSKQNEIRKQIILDENGED